MKKSYRFAAITAAALTAGGLYAAVNSSSARSRRMKKRTARAMKAVGSVFDHISSSM